MNIFFKINNFININKGEKMIKSSVKEKKEEN